MLFLSYLHHPSSVLPHPQWSGQAAERSVHCVPLSYDQLLRHCLVHILGIRQLNVRIITFLYRQNATLHRQQPYSFSIPSRYFA